ncbi:thioredoxin domain-containing protein 15 [Pseudophryne corroboree]|uniref:thioredoxin domain-containing protein 15 n=1 Tax=Pseudophryne corroboree TaxID=495146 RepID=UPI003081D075
MELCLRAVLLCGLCALSLIPGAPGIQNEDLRPEDDSQRVMLQSTDAIPSAVNNEDVRGSESIQYKTAEIADAMQTTDIQADPAVILSMVPPEVKDRLVTEAPDSVCDAAKYDAKCSANNDSPAPSDNQVITKTQNTDTSAPEAEQSRADDTNTTDSGKPLKVSCEERNITGMENFTLQVLNVSQDLMEMLNPNSSECTMVLFFTPWCRFSASLAPHFNALPRAFPTLNFLALDASQHSSLSTRFGTVAVPNILLFQGAKPMARFNHTERTLEALKSFIFNQSGIEAEPDIVLTEADHEGPLPCNPQAGIDWLLAFSILYVTVFILYATLQTESIRWLIPGQEHEHQE